MIWQVLKNTSKLAWALVFMEHGVWTQHFGFQSTEIKTSKPKSPQMTTLLQKVWYKIVGLQMTVQHDTIAWPGLLGLCIE